MSRYFIDGHAIVSAQGRYADSQGNMPEALRFEADWQRFQAALDHAALTVLGRKGHEANPKPEARRRLVLSRRAPEPAQLARDVYWTRPDLASLTQALDRLVADGERVAVVGGTGVFDQFLTCGYDTFHLVVATKVDLPGGRPVFTGAHSVEDVETRLRSKGLAITERLEIDRANAVFLHLYSRKRKNPERFPLKTITL